jgi:diguanylate cyclase (GGDEF)-like protein
MDSNLIELEAELIKYKQLSLAAAKFHSYKDKEEILEKIIVTFEEIFPMYRFKFLPHEHNSFININNRDDDFNDYTRTALRAFITGKIQIDQSMDKKFSILSAPLMGSKGISGVIQVNVPNTLGFSKTDVEIITSLANIIACALENAKLYSQSKLVHSELQLIQETSQKLNSNMRLTEMIKYISSKIIETFSANEAGFIIFSKDHNHVRVLPGSTPFFLSNPSKIYLDLLEAKIHREKEPIFIEDLNLPIMNEDVRYASIMAVPITQGNSIKGFAIALHQKSNFFSIESFKLMQALILHSTQSLNNSLLREELENMIITDHLTKLHSRNYLDENIQYSMKDDKEGTFILIDIDNFKEINDTFGHQIGDDVLIQVAELIKKNIRGNDVGARWGGEEMAIYLPKVSLDEGLVIAERLVRTIAESTFPKITVSCGVSYWNKEKLDTYKYLFKRADEALYLAKGTGKNKVVAQKTA